MPLQRDHVIVVISIFLALGLGIIMGAALSDNVIVRHQMDIMESLKNEIKRLALQYESLEESYGELEEEVSLWESLGDTVLPGFIDNRFQEISIGLLTRDQDSKEFQVWDFLNSAGVEKESMTWIQLVRPGEGEVLQWQGVAYNLDIPGERSAYYDSLAARLGGYWLGGEGQDTIYALEEKGLLNLGGRLPPRDCRLIYQVMDRGQLDIPLLNALSRAGLEVMVPLYFSHENWERPGLEGVRFVHRPDTARGKLEILSFLLKGCQ